MLELDQIEQEYELGEAGRPSILRQLAKGGRGGGGGGVKTKLVKHNRSESVVVKK